MAGPGNLLLTPSFLHIPDTWEDQAFRSLVQEVAGSSSNWFAREFWLGLHPLSTPSAQIDWGALASGDGRGQEVWQNLGFARLLFVQPTFLRSLFHAHGDAGPLLCSPGPGCGPSGGLLPSCMSALARSGFCVGPSCLLPQMHLLC